MEITTQEFQVIEVTEEQIKQAQELSLRRINSFYEKAAPYEIGNWLDHFKAFTMPSYSFIMTSVQAYILHLIYYEKEIPSKIIPDLKAFQNKIQTFIHQHFSDGCFCKLTTRSPKDAMWHCSQNQVQTTVQKMINYLKNYGVEEITDKITPQISQLFYKFLLEQNRNKLHIKNAKQFIEIFSKSDRIVIDLSDISILKGNLFTLCKQGDYQNIPLTTVWGREWAQIRWEQQFRCFYKDFTLIAISQYDQHCYFQQVYKNKVKIQRSIQQFFKQIKSSLKQSGLINGVMDLVVKINNNNEQFYPIRLIEINIFNQSTRASLFKWNELFQNDRPLQMRVIQQCMFIPKFVLTRMMGMIDKGLELVLRQVCKQLKGEQLWQQYS